jgi:hypothetical protein
MRKISSVTDMTAYIRAVVSGEEKRNNKRRAEEFGRLFQQLRDLIV